VAKKKSISWPPCGCQRIHCSSEKEEILIRKDASSYPRRKFLGHQSEDIFKIENFDM
jgi:hypothetical protein